MDLTYIVTVEGIQDREKLHPVQTSMLKHHGAQCGYCTPGFICAMAQMTEDCVLEQKPLTEKKVKNYLTGNLCRCTGYQSIIDAGVDVDLTQVSLLQKRYLNLDINREFESLCKKSVDISSNDQRLLIPTSLKELLEYKDEHQHLKPISGATDLGVQVNKDKYQKKWVLSLNHCPELYQFKEDDAYLYLGAKLNLEQISDLTEKSFPEFSRLINIFASPQIKNTATMVGNIVNASPIADSIPFLLVAESTLVIESKGKKRELDINQFYRGYKQFDLNEDEVITSVKIPKNNFRFKLYKVSVRKDLDISAVTFGASYKIDNNKLTHLNIALGGVAATVIRLPQIENDLVGKSWDRNLFEQKANEITGLIQPFSDVRGSAEYRQQVCRNLLLKFFDHVSEEIGIGKLEGVEI
jgi:xanthine dehydrogenase small subunit